MREKSVCVRLSEEEYESVSGYAKALGMSVPAYMRTSAKQNCVLEMRYENVRMLTKEMSELKLVIDRIITMYTYTDAFAPGQVETIVKLMGNITVFEKEILNEILDAEKKFKKTIKSTMKANFKHLLTEKDKHKTE